MKKLLSVLSSTPQGGLRGGLLIFALLATSTLWAHDFEVNGIYYNYLDSNNVEVTYRGDCTICHDNEYSGSVTIPETVTHDGTTYRVTSIGGTAFAGCSDLKSVTIGNSVTSIGSAVFQECYSLSSVTIPNSVTSIGESAFSFCSALTSLTIPNSVTNIGDRAFTFCSALISLNIPNSVTNIGHQALSYCSALTSVIIGNSVTSIDSWAFYDCSSLNSITIPNSVTSIGEYAFYNCSGLTLVTIGDGLTSIGARAFDYCKNIEEIYCYPITPPAIESSSFCNYSKATLYVPCDSKEVYEQHPIFGKFEKIKGIEGCGEYVTTHIYDTICQGDVYEFGEYLCDTTGTYTAFIDLVPTYLHLTVLPSSIDTITVEAYDSYEWHGKVYTESGTYIYEEHCYQEILQLTIIDTPTPPSAIQDDIYYADTICEGEIYVWMGMEFTETGTYTYTYEEIVEDKDYIYLHILYLTVLPLETIEYEMIAYDSYEWHGVVYTESGTYIYEEHCYQEILQLTIIDTPTPPEPEIPTEGIGVFSVGEGKTVTFSRGNLQYTQSTNTWSFAENQYDYIGTDNVTGGSVSSDPTIVNQKYGDALADKIDLFGWSTSTTNFGVSTSTDYNDYSGSFVDWGTNQIGSDAPNIWRTLTYDEWYYLRHTRTNASSLCGVAQVNGVNGLVFLPDSWTCPEGVTFKSGFSSEWSVAAYGQYQTFTAEQWSLLESAGAVFLPAAGSRGGSNVYNVQRDSGYWSATEDDSNFAYFLYFHSDEASWSDIWRGYGQSVRLVKDISNTTPEPPVEPQDTTIYHPTEYATICEGTTFVWMGMEFTEIGTYTYEEIIEDENYIYHYIHTLELQVIAPPEPDTIVVEAYDSYEWHGKVYTESGTYIYEEHCYQEILQLTIIDTPTPPEPQDTTIYISHPTEYGAICEGGEYYWRGVMITVAGTYTYNEIVEEENYTYLHTYTLELLPLLPDEMIELPTTEVTICENELPYVWHICGGVWEITEAGNYMHHESLDCGVAIYTLELTVIPSEKVVLVEEAYDSYEWHGKVYTESGVYTYRDPYNTCVIEELHLTIIDTPTPPEPEIPTEGIGVFSIGEGKTVTFSRGNLQYTQSTNTWSFASAQWEMIGTDNVTGGSVSSDPTYGDKKYGDALADKVDLFGWSTGATNFGVSTSTDWENDYLGSFVDWGRNKIGNDAPNTWRTLTHDEWYYLRYNRTNADNLVGVAQVNGVKGLVFLPDTWICPEGVTFKSGFSSDYSVEAYGQYQTFTAKQWSVLESVGAVFLPAAGLRNGSFMERVQGNGYYWSASGYNSYYADYLYFYSDRAGMSGYYRDNGQSVRLVKDVNSTTPEPPVEPETEEIFIYQPVDSVTICEWELPYIWRGMYCTEAGPYTHEEIVEDENYIYHYIHTLALQVLPSSIETIVVEAYDSYEWHGKVYTESGVYTYHDPYNRCVIEELHLTIIPSEEKEYVHYYYNDIFVCDGDTYEDPITGIYHLIVEHTTWSDTITGTEVDTIYTFNITPIVAPEPLTEDILYAIGAVPELVAGEMVNTMGTTEPIMWYYQMNDKDDIADVIGVEWVAGHDVVLNTEQTTHTMVLEVWDECYNTRSMKFTFPVSKKDSAPQDTTIYHPTVYETICEGTTFTWMGMDCTEAGLYEYHEIVEGEDYTYHHIYTLELTILPYKRVEYEMIAYDSYEWHGWVYTESGTHTYQSDECTTEVLYLTIIPSEHNQGEVVVEPSTNSVTITWQKEDDADTYIIVIKQGDKVVCTLIFDAEGNLVSVNYLPGRESNKHGIQHAGLTSDSFQYTITGLTPSTDYTYTVTATDDSDNTISSYSGEFTTHHATSVENTNSPSPTIDCQKILYEDHIYILRDGKIYSIMGQEM